MEANSSLIGWNQLVCELNYYTYYFAYPLRWREEGVKLEGRARSFPFLSPPQQIIPLPLEAVANATSVQ